jgi:NitT/TauT family transport system permease protein
LGLGLGISAGIILSIFIVCFRTCEIILFPLIIILQTFPKIALAPTLLFWMGPGIVPKIVISALISFFPILVSFTKGLKSLEPDLEDLLTVYQANKKEVFLRARIPGALPDFFAGLKSAVPYSVTGAIAAEFAGAYKGLGYLILGAQASYNTSLVFAAAFFLSCIGVGLFVTVRFIEKRIISWHVSETTKLMW